MLIWITARVGIARPQWDAGVRFWSSVTGYRASWLRDEPDGPDEPDGLAGLAGLVVRDMPGALVPPDGDAYLRVRRQAAGPTRVCLDLHMSDPSAAVDDAMVRGARQAAGHGHGALFSPGGMPFRIVAGHGGRRPGAATWHDPALGAQAGTYAGPGTGTVHLSAIDQVALDIPREHWTRELAFWSGLTGWAARRSEDEFAPLDRPAGQPLRLLPHRLDELTGPVRAHLDLASSDRAAETARHVNLGACVVRVHDEWTVLRSPDGHEYCVTDRGVGPAPTPRSASRGPQDLTDEPGRPFA